MSSATTKFAFTLAAAVAITLLASCGGGSGSAVVQPPPPPPPLSISTASLPTGFYSEFYSATLQASGGSGARTWSIASGILPRGLNLDHSSGIVSGVIVENTGFFSKTFSLSVRDASSTVTKSFDLSWSTRQGRILTTSLPAAFRLSRYSVTLATTNPSFNIQLLSGNLPPGIQLGGQLLDGTPTTTGPNNFVLGISDSTGAIVDQRAFSIMVNGAGSGAGNDSIGTATPLSSGIYTASISPFVDPASGSVPSPDQDYYRLVAQPGSTVSIEIRSELLGTPLDSVIELLDASGTRLNSCDSPGQSGFTHSCLDDDNVEDGTLDSKILFRAPAGAATTFFLHVLDWRGDARPDMVYQFQIFGVD